MLDILAKLAPFAATFAAGAVVALKVIAPRTKSKWDDKVLDFLVAAVPFLPHEAPKPPAQVRDRIIDHRAKQLSK